MSVGVSIKPLTASDGGIYRALMLRAYSEHPEAFTSTFEERAGKPVDWWTKRLTDPTTVTLGAFDATEALIGSARLEAFQRARERHKVALAAVYVMKDYANRGIGRRLVEEALGASRRMNSVEIMNLTVTADNLPAVRLFSRMGFQTFGREIRAERSEGAYFDRLSMWRPVSADYIA